MRLPQLPPAALVWGVLAAAGCGNVTMAPADGGQDVATTGAGGASTGSGGATGGSAGTGTGSGGINGGAGGAGGAGGVGVVGSDCRSNGECSSVGAPCLAPGESPGCGVCKQPTYPCTTDAYCASREAGSVCELTPCSCSGEKSCVAGCLDGTSCGAGQFCAADHRCANNVCQPGDRSCLPNFACGNDGHCTRKSCVLDADCTGACVKGLCYPRPGTCTPPAA